jgi:phage shock protein C
MSDRLYRSRDDRMLSGVAGGLARVMGADPSIVRIVWVLLTFLSGGIALVVYIVMAIVVPEAPPGWESLPSGQPAGSGPPRSAPPGGWIAPDGSVVPFAGGSPDAGSTSGGPGWPAATPGEWRQPRSSGDGRRAGVVIGAILILLGGAFLVREFMPQVDLSQVWPVIFIGIGVVLLLLSVRPSRTSG